MAVIDWPTSDVFRPVLPFSFGVDTPKSGFRGFRTGAFEGVGHLADRYVCSISLPPCMAQQAAQREALLMTALSRGDRFRFGPFHRRAVMGTIAGALTVASSVLAGSRTVSVLGASTGTTLLGGDFLSLAGNLLQVGADGAVSAGPGVPMQITLVLPLAVPAVAGAAVVYSSPTGQWQLDVTDSMEFDYGCVAMQMGVTIEFRQFIA